MNQKDEGTLDDRGRDGGTNFILRIKEQETRLTLQEHDDDDDNDELSKIGINLHVKIQVVPHTKHDVLLLQNVSVDAV